MGAAEAAHEPQEPEKGLEAVPDPDELVIEAGGQITMVPGGRKADQSTMTFQGGEVTVEGQFTKGERVKFEIEGVVSEITFTDLMDRKTGDDQAEARHEARRRPEGRGLGENRGRTERRFKPRLVVPGAPRPGAVVQAQERPERASERPSEATTDLSGLTGRQLHLLLEGLHFLGDPDAALREQLEAAYRRVARKENP